MINESENGTNNPSTIDNHSIMYHVLLIVAFNLLARLSSNDMAVDNRLLAKMVLVPSGCLSFNIYIIDNVPNFLITMKL